MGSSVHILKPSWDRSGPTPEATGRVSQTTPISPSPPQPGRRRQTTVRDALRAPRRSRDRGSSAASAARPGWSRPPALSRLRARKTSSRPPRPSPGGRPRPARAGIRQRERQGEMGHMACSSVCGGWFGMMDDGSRACRTHLRTFRRCAGPRGVVSGAFKNVRIPARGEEEVRVSPRIPALSRGYAAAARMRARSGLRE